MMMKELFADDVNITNPVIDIDDESILADGMIPDSQIIKLIDELGSVVTRSQPKERNT